MKVISVSGHKKLRFKNPILAIGVFDGVHAGHQYLIRKVVKKASVLGGTSVVMTFWPHPVHVLKPELNLSLLTPLPLRLKLIESLGVDVCLVVKFTKKFSQLSPQKFVEKFLGRMIHPQEVFVGDDFRFGHDRVGHLDFLKKKGSDFGFKVNIISSVHVKGYDISSTFIRRLILEGKLTQASWFLNRKVSFLGTVIKGDSRGKKLGYPTANFDPDFYVIVPRGVYLAYVKIGNKKYNALANVGRRPSFKKTNNAVNIEVHILNFKKNIYGKEILVEFIRKLRDEKEFSSNNELIAQIQQDEIKAKKFFASL